MLIQQRETAIHSHNQILKEGVKIPQKEIILECIKKCGPISDRRISVLTGIPLSRVPDRRGQLLYEDKICEAGILYDEVTHKPVLNYKYNITPGIPFTKVSMQKKRHQIIEICKADGSELATKILEILNT